jgi:hypothetical protein
MKKINLLFLVLFFLTSCQSIKDGLSGNKGENSDEFLVQKKNPLVTPPKYLELPTPKSESIEVLETNVDNATDIEDLLKTKSDTKNISSKSYGNAEEFVLENIK